MKMTRLKTTLAFCFLLSMTAAQAQERTYRSNAAESPVTFTLGTGASLTGGTFRGTTFLIKTIYPKLETFHTPAFQGTIDYNVNQRFSFGLAYSRQINQITGVDIDTKGFDLRIDLNAVKSNVALKCLVHYGLKLDKVSFYSGLRLNYTNTKVTLDTEGDLSDILDYLDTLVNLANDNFYPALVPIGMRVWFTDNIGGYIEGQIGSPHFASAGVAFQF